MLTVSGRFWTGWGFETAVKGMILPPSEMVRQIHGCVLVEKHHQHL